eukprot:5670989-Alexandrium_andersonii.AAC.1
MRRSAGAATGPGTRPWKFRAHDALFAEHPLGTGELLSGFRHRPATMPAARASAPGAAPLVRPQGPSWGPWSTRLAPAARPR